jgi:hypothetical protein
LFTNEIKPTEGDGYDLTIVKEMVAWRDESDSLGICAV